MKKGQCPYGEWMVTRIPCKHMVPCVHRKRIEFKDVGHAYFSVKIFRKTYLEALIARS